MRPPARKLRVMRLLLLLRIWTCFVVLFLLWFPCGGDPRFTPPGKRQSDHGCAAMAESILRGNH